jgi:hypothetical protein
MVAARGARRVAGSGGGPAGRSGHLSGETAPGGGASLPQADQTYIDQVVTFVRIRPVTLSFASRRRHPQSNDFA